MKFFFCKECEAQVVLEQKEDTAFICRQGHRTLVESRKRLKVEKAVDDAWERNR